VFCRLVVLVRLSVPVQVIDWKDSSPNLYSVDGDVKPYSLTHSLTAIQPPFDSHSTAVRPFYDHSTLRPIRSGLLHCGLSKQAVGGRPPQYVPAQACKWGHDIHHTRIWIRY